MFAVGQGELVRKGQYAVVAIQMRRQFGDLSVELNFLAVRGFEPRRAAPMREPVEQFGVGQYERFITVLAVVMRFGQPLNELPVVRQKQFLLMRGARGEFDDFLERTDFIDRKSTRLNSSHLVISY